MNREELVAEIAKQTKLTQKSVGEVLTAIIDVTQDTVKKGEKVNPAEELISYEIVEETAPVEEATEEVTETTEE